MNTRTASTIRAVLELLGRGATPVDASQWVDPGARGIEKKASAGVEKNDAYWAKVAADTALIQPRRYIYPCNSC